MAVPGFRLPMHVSAPGKAFLAECDEVSRVRCTEGRLDRCTANSVTSIDALSAELETIRKTGIAVDIEEHGEDVCALAMLVQIGLTDRYAIAVPVPARRFDEARERIEQALRACVEEIEARR